MVSSHEDHHGMGNMLLRSQWNRCWHGDAHRATNSTILENTNEVPTFSSNPKASNRTDDHEHSIFAIAVRSMDGKTNTNDIIVLHTSRFQIKKTILDITSKIKQVEELGGSSGKPLVWRLYF